MSSPTGPPSAVAAVERSLARLAAADRPEAWVHVAVVGDCLTRARAVDERVAAGEHLALAGVTLAVKDNIDVAGMPTTAGCPAFSYLPTVSAPAVQRLVDAGAIVIGKTSLDQFATGLTGTRSPLGPCRNAVDPRYISGGSSSGSAVAVALGIVDVGLGTDTAGSGRVPAAFNGIVGLKPTRGIVPMQGVVPACASLDCISVFATSVASASHAVDIMAAGPATRPASARAPEGAFRFGVPLPHQLDFEGDPLAEKAFRAAVEAVATAGGAAAPVDITALLEAGDLLYDGAVVAERYAAVGAFIASHPEEVEPTVGSIILAAGRLPAHRLLADRARLAELTAVSTELWRDIDILLLPTAPTIFTIEEVAAEPVRRNSVLGRYNNFANLLDLCAAVVPAPRRADGLPFGITLFAPAGHDHVVAGLGARVMGEAVPPLRIEGLTPLAVVGAHLSGQPLHHQLTDRHAVLLAATTTAPVYRLHALPTAPPKPGLVRVGAGGAAIDVEVWGLTERGFGSFVAAVPAPMVIGTIELADGTAVKGFLCEPHALEGAPDITRFGGWRAALQHGGGSP